MSWELIKGVEPKPELPIKRCLKLDGVNDYLTLGNNPFYNVGMGEFTFAFEILKYTDKNTSAIFRSADDTGVADSSRIVINFINNTNRLQIALVTATETYDSFIYELGSDLVTNFFKLIIIRKGNNHSDSDDVVNYPNSIRNPANYHLYLNGVKKEPTSVSMLNPKGLTYMLDNSKAKILGGITNFSTYFLQGYYALFGYWNRALTHTEIQNINNGILDDYQAKGLFLFDGNTLDSSSVQGTMTLLNSATPTYITYPYKAGVIPFAKSIANQVKNFTYASTVTITKIWKEQGAYNGFQYSLNGGASWTNIPDGELVTVSIVVPVGITLKIKDPTSRADYNVLHLDFN